MDISAYTRECLRKDEEFILYRGRPGQGEALDAPSVLLLAPASKRPALETLDKISREYELRSELDTTWAVRPIDLSQCDERTALVLEDPGGEPLHRLIHGPMEIKQFLLIAVGLATAIGQLHARGLIHKDVKPSNVLVDVATGNVWLTGFGIASRLPRERQFPEPPEFIAGTLPYMAPEQTGRMNRSIDSRSDLYALGVTLYETLTGVLPFTASEPMEWVHCHIARQPMPPGERVSSVPGPVSAIIMKLLAKTAEERYQTASGVEGDLRRCLNEWEAHGRIAEFSPGEHDVPDRLVIPEKLYGRAREFKVLLGAFDRVVADGRPGLMLVSGYSGIGKSTFVNELHKALVPPRRGLFVSGKFDQYKRDIPYVTLGQAFQSLIRPLLGSDERELRRWRDALLAALGPNGRLITDMVPELKLIIGEQPPVPELPPQDAQGRFQLVFRRFIGVFARPEHPLVLFLDDLQWLDAATLDVLEDLLTQQDVHHLMLIGAYRNNEVNSAHPLMRKLEAIRQAGGNVHEIVLAPLAAEDLERLIADSLHCDQEKATPLAELIHAKTGGNPFFALQFISALAEEELLKFDNSETQWSWDLNRIYAKGYTDNVADLMVGKLNRLPLETQSALQQLACLGNSADFAMLRMVYQGSNEETHGQLSEALRIGFIFRSENSYSFVHDRIQEAAYSLIPQELRAKAHLRIGKLLEAHTLPEKREEGIFEIVNQLNRAAVLIASREEREHLARLNLIAGKRAKASTAYSSALKYLIAGAELLDNSRGEQRDDLTFALELNRAECEFLTGQPAAAEQRLTMLSSRATNTVELATVACLRMDLYTTLDQSDRAVDVCLDYLRHLGVNWSPHPTEEEVRGEYEQIWSHLGSRTIEELIETPLMSDPACLATLDVLTKVVPPAMFRDANLGALAICRAVNLSLEHGLSDGSSFVFVYLGMVAGPHFGNYDAGFRFGQLGYELTERRGLKRFQARTYMCFGSHVIPWTKHFRACRDLIHLAFDAANKIGDICFAAYSRNNFVTNLLATGDPLSDVQREAENALEFAQNARFGLVTDIIIAQSALVRMLRGLTKSLGSFDDGQFDELRFESHLASDPAALPECFYWIRKLQARLFAGDYLSAVDASLKAERLLWTAPSNLEMAEYHLYGGLSRSSSWNEARPDQKLQHFEALMAHHKQLKAWAENCPENFENRSALVGAEIARIEGRVLDAEDLYEQAIRSAHASGFVHNEALANEFAARFYAARGFEKIAYVYLRDARYGYLRWGATGKVRQLDKLYPNLMKEEPTGGTSSTIVARGELLDLATVIKVSQAVSGEMVLEKLIDRIMRAAIEHAGAERGLLIFPQGDELQVKAEAATSGNDVAVYLRGPAETGDTFPESVARYVARTRKDVILDDATAENPFSADTYFARQPVRSIVCLPLVNQGRINGILYLENSLSAHVFTSDRITLLKVLASQAAISLENTRLYRDLENREAKIRRLVDANILGITSWNVEGAILASNEAFLRMVQYEHEDVAAGRVRWRDMTPADWRERVERALAEVIQTGRVQPFESELFRKDGSRLPVLVAAALFEEGGNEGVAFTLDLSEQKRADEALRRSESYLAQAQRLAHAGSWAWEAPTRKALYISEEWYRIFGFDPKDGMPTWEQRSQRVYSEDRARWQATIDRAIAEKSDYEVEFRILPPHSTIKYIHSVGHPVLDSSGQLLQFVGVSLDVTERKRAEEALRSSEAYLMEAQKLTHTGSCAIDGASREILYWSEEMFRLFGFDPQQGLPMWDQWLDRIHPEDRDKFRMAGDRTFLEKVHCDVEFRALKPDGTVSHIHGTGHPVLNPNGELMQVVGTMVDITERRRAEQALRRSEAYLAESQRLNHTGSWASDGTTHEALYWSEEMFRIFGFDPQQGLPVREQWLQRIHPEDRDKVKRQASDRMFVQMLDSDLEYRIVLPDGTVKHIHGLAHPVFNSDKELLEVVGTAVDITEHKRAENERERLHQLQADLAHINRVSMMGELSASLAHEIKQPIFAASADAETCLRWLERDQPDLVEAQEAALRVMKDVGRASDIITRTVSLFKKGVPQRESVDITAVIQEMIALLRGEAGRYSISIHAELTDGLPKLEADRVALQQVLMNLMLNAIDAMKESGTPGRLTIATRQVETRQILVSVSDTGRGLPPEKTEQIFNAFVTSKPQGTGLGLPISRSIIESHGGRLWATSNSGPGATFQFTLPLEAAARQSA